MYFLNLGVKEFVVIRLTSHPADCLFHGHGIPWFHIFDINSSRALAKKCVYCLSGQDSFASCFEPSGTSSQTNFV